jgi:hypothetical protein
LARLRTNVERATTLHRHAAALMAVAGKALDGYSPAAAPLEQYAEQHDLAARLRAEAAVLAPEWLGAPLDAITHGAPLGGASIPTHVRVGLAHPLDDARFPVVLPLLGVGHLAIDADARDPRVAGLLRSLVLRLLATAPPGSLVIRSVDAAGARTTLAAFAGIDEVLPPAAGDRIGLRDVLTEAEEWVRSAQRATQPVPAGAGAQSAESAADRTADLRPPRHLVVLIASLPELTEGIDLVRISGLAKVGPAARVHLVVAGWPPPPLTAETTQPPLTRCTQITLRNPYAWVGNTPGDSFAAPAGRPVDHGSGIMPGRLNAPIYLDPDPPAELVRLACERLAAQLAANAAGPVTTPGPEIQTAWREYVASAQRLDAVRQKAAAVVAEQSAALRAAQEELAALRARLAGQQERLRELAHWAQFTAPVLVPEPGELATANAAPVSSPASASAALQAAHRVADSIDAQLSMMEDFGEARPYLRNAAVYGAYALVAALAQILVFVLASETSPVAIAAIPCGLVLPVVAFLLGWLTCGLFAAGPGETTPDRTAALGLWISALAAVPLFGMIAWVLVGAITS